MFSYSLCYFNFVYLLTLLFIISVRFYILVKHNTFILQPIIIYLYVIQKNTEITKFPIKGETFNMDIFKYNILIFIQNTSLTSVYYNLNASQLLKLLHLLLSAVSCYASLTTDYHNLHNQIIIINLNRHIIDGCDGCGIQYGNHTLWIYYNGIHSTSLCIKLNTDSLMVFTN